MLTPCRGLADLEGPQVKAGPGETLSGCQEGERWGRRWGCEFPAQVPGLWLLEEKTGAKGTRASGESCPVGQLGLGASLPHEHRCSGGGKREGEAAGWLASLRAWGAARRPAACRQGGGRASPGPWLPVLPGSQASLHPGPGETTSGL